MVEEKEGREWHWKSKVWCLAQKKTPAFQKLEKKSLRSLFSRIFGLTNITHFVYLASDSYAQQGYAVAPHPVYPCPRHRLGGTSFLSLAGCSATASTTPAAGPAIAAAPASTSSRGSLPLLTAQTNASVSWS